MRSFADINFGKADAREEGTLNPELLIQGYLDNSGLKNTAIKESKFLFLGYKGSGKSALSEHLRLTSKQNEVFVTNILLKDFPYRAFASIINNNEVNEVRLPITWSWLLLVYCIDSISKDSNRVKLFADDFEVTLDNLRKKGILPIKNLNDIIAKSAEQSFKLNIASILEYSSNHKIENSDMKFFHIVDALKKIIKAFDSKWKHLIVIDGLDEILTREDIQYQSIAALISEAKDLNNYFIQHSIPVKIIVFCRTDLFERLPHPNKNKIRQDSAYQFDWFKNSYRPENSALVSLANLRASLLFPEITNIFHDFFPRFINSTPIYAYLINVTRHTPRDFLQLLKYIQQATTGPKVTTNEVFEGIREYSNSYFLPEIKDELVGYIEYDEIEDFFQAIATLGKRSFMLEDLKSNQRVIEITSKINLNDILETLFECSGIGHLKPKKGKPGSHNYMFKYRNRHLKFSPSYRIIVHSGIWKALYLVD